MTNSYGTDINAIEDLADGVLYKKKILQSILQNRGLSHSVYFLRDAETYKCLDYTCGYRHEQKPKDMKCIKCGGMVRSPLVKSPRTPGRGLGVGHRRYSKTDIIDIVTSLEKLIR